MSATYTGFDISRIAYVFIRRMFEASAILHLFVLAKF